MNRVATTDSIRDRLWRKKWFLVFVYFPLAILCALVGYRVGLIEAYVWFQMNGGGIIYEEQWKVDRDLRSLMLELEEHQKKHGTFPDRLDATALSRRDNKNIALQFDAQGRPLDPWGRPYHYEVVNGQTEISTLGRDGVAGGRGLDADLSYKGFVRSFPEPSLSEFLDGPTAMRERSERLVISWVCASLPLVVFAITLWRRLTRPAGRHAARWLLSVVPTALAFALAGGPALLVLLIAALILYFTFGLFIWMVWMIFTYWTGRPVPPLFDH